MRRLTLLLASLTAVGVAAEPAPDGPSSVFDHSGGGRWWLSGQVNIITQAHPAFVSPYSGINSFRSAAEAATSYVATVYSGLAVTSTTELQVDLESAAGGGLSDALGLGGFTNLDVVRNPTLSAVPYLGRAVVRQVIPLGSTWAPAARGPLGSLRSLPVRRLELRVGKMSTADLFDVNAVASDSHLQFTNWALCNTGAYDYAADTRGYTPGAVIEFDDAFGAVRFGEMMMPSVANGLYYDTDLSHARAENLELELRHHLLPQRAGTLRLLGFLNHARMGSYREANSAATTGGESPPDIESHRHAGATKVGLGLNLEQELGAEVRAFVRLGWNDGLNETFAYTEIDDTAAAGFDLRGGSWRRPEDRAGLGIVTNGLSPDHRRYLELGGAGFILGDGGLRYGRESILEAYYAALLFRGVSLTGDVQAILNPGYNQDRGPAVVLSLRVHLEL